MWQGISVSYYISRTVLKVQRWIMSANFVHGVDKCEENCKVCKQQVFISKIGLNEVRKEYENGTWKHFQ